MSKKYQHLLSPIKIGNTVFKNRLTTSPSAPMLIQGSETYPTEALITHYANKARNGAALVTCQTVGMPHGKPDAEPATYSAKRMLAGSFDVDDGQCQRYLAQLTAAIHFYGGKASTQISGYVPAKYDVSTGIPSIDVGISAPRVGQEISADALEEVAEDYVRVADLMKQVGFDMVNLHMSYRFTILGRFLSPLTNKRSDQYGGSLENQARFPLMVADRIKQKCGKDFLIEAQISGAEPPGGLTLQDTMKLARMFAGHIDMLQIRGGEIDPSHPAGFNRERTPFLHMAEAIKKSDPGLAIVTVGGYQDLDVCEDVIASGKADFIAVARGWISNTEYGRLAYEGRGEDVVPCIRCNMCIGHSPADPPVSFCSVNPTWGFEHKIERMTQLPVRRKKVAIIGGGPAGMEAALIASGRGHHVTLYEKSDVLGGLLKTTENVSFKWPVRDFEHYLIRQIGKAKNVKVRLNTEATPEMLKKERYDAVLVAVGSEPIVPQIPGVGGKQVVFAKDVYGNEDALADKVVVIGGGEVGVETGMHLAETGHDVTLIEILDRLASNAPPLHFYSMFKEAWEKLPNFKYVLKARCSGIKENEVSYVDEGGVEHTVAAGSVVIAVGMKPKNDLALTFSGTADAFFIIGDCDVAGNVQKAMRSAFSTASML